MIMKAAKRIIILILPFFLFSCAVKKPATNDSNSEKTEQSNESEKEPVSEITVEEEFEIELEENQETNGG